MFVDVFAFSTLLHHSYKFGQNNLFAYILYNSQDGTNILRLFLEFDLNIAEYRLKSAKSQKYNLGKGTIHRVFQNVIPRFCLCLKFE